MHYFTFDRCEVIEFEGGYDPLYGTVEPAYEWKGSHQLPRQMFRLGQDVWKTRQEALAVLKADCELEVERALMRRRLITELDVQYRESQE